MIPVEQIYELSPEVNHCNNLMNIRSNSMLMQDIYNKVLSIAQLRKHIIIIGEIGSGKKRLAQTIHTHSDKKHGPFHTFYCVDIDEAEYKDAFWEHLNFENDHIVLKYDALEKAGDGTLYLDQFSEMPYPYMINILESYHQGCKQLFRYNEMAAPRLILSFNNESFNRIIHTATWKKILALLDPIAIMLPPLRERKEDIPCLIHCFIEEIRLKNSDWQNVNVSSDVITECINYEWPGNIRQLKNAITQGAILSYGKTIQKEHLPFSINWKLPYRSDKQINSDKE
jgi:two-component system, NtrC family, response regulator HydG